MNADGSGQTNLRRQRHRREPAARQPAPRRAAGGGRAAELRVRCLHLPVRRAAGRDHLSGHQPGQAQDEQHPQHHGLAGDSADPGRLRAGQPPAARRQAGRQPAQPDLLERPLDVGPAHHRDLDRSQRADLHRPDGWVSATINYEQSETGRGVETSAQSHELRRCPRGPGADPRTTSSTFKFLQAMDEIRVFTRARARSSFGRKLSAGRSPRTSPSPPRAASHPRCSRSTTTPMTRRSPPSGALKTSPSAPAIRSQRRCRRAGRRRARPARTAARSRTSTSRQAKPSPARSSTGRTACPTPATPSSRASRPPTCTKTGCRRWPGGRASSPMPASSCSPSSRT